VLFALTESEDESETERHDLGDHEECERCVVPLAAQVGGKEKRADGPKKKEEVEKRAW